MPKNKVVILLDGSEFRERILPAVQRFLRPAENELILFRVSDPVHGIHYHDGPLHVDVYDDEAEAIKKAELSEELQQDRQLLEAIGYPVGIEVRFGKTAEVVEDFIRREEVDLVAMTTHGRTGLSKLWQGSIAEHVLHHVSIPVLLLYAPD
jgi:nucleotide-binding universal stress UspA family protein